MIDSKIFHVTEGTNGKFEIKYIQFGKKDDTIWQEHNRKIVGTLSGQLNEPKRMEAFKLKSKQDLQIQVQDKIIKNLTNIRTDVNIDLTKINKTQNELDIISAYYNDTLTKLSTPPNWLKNHSKLDPLKDIILQQINHCNETKSELNKSREILLKLIQDIDISIQRLKDDVILNSTNQEKFKSKPAEYTALLKNQMANYINLMKNLMEKIHTAPEIKTIVEDFLQKLKESTQSSPVIRRASIKNPISLKPLISEVTVKSVNNNGLTLEKVNLNSPLEKQ